MNDKILILAAGNSSRLGKNKQFLTIDGDTIINRCIKMCENANLGHIYVVTGSNNLRLEELIKSQNVSITYNPNWDKGMGSSIAVGISSLPEDTSGVYIVLPDQIKLTAEHMLKIHAMKLQNQESIITSKYGNQFGAPTFFPASFFDALRECVGLKGAKKVIQENIELVKYVDFKGGEIDIDTTEDLKHVD